MQLQQLCCAPVNFLTWLQQTAVHRPTDHPCTCHLTTPTCTTTHPFPSQLCSHTITNNKWLLQLQARLFCLAAGLPWGWVIIRQACRLVRRSGSLISTLLAIRIITTLVFLILLQQPLQLQLLNSNALHRRLLVQRLP